jgi:hypothetical protein
MATDKRKLGPTQHAYFSFAFDFHSYFMLARKVVRGIVCPKLNSCCGVLSLFGGGCSGEHCSGGIQISAERRISWRANCLVFAPAVFKIRRAPQETGFCCSSGILITQSTTWVFCSAGNPPPRGNPGLKCTRTDDILKKLEFKMNFK